MSPLLLQTLTAFCVTLGAIFALSPLARKLGLTDKPNARKRHQGEIPLVGGAAIFIALVIGGFLWGDSNQSLIMVNGNDALWVFMLSGFVLITMGTLDDRYHLGVFMRTLTEVAVALIVIEGLELRVGSLGNLFGDGAVTLTPTIAYPFTIVAIFGIINAFNMLDGMDGLLGSLVLGALVTLHLFTGIAPGFVSLFIGASLVAFLVSNLKLSPLIPKVFLGDAGSKLLGFIMVCLILAAASQQVGGKKLISPATALFIVALPLYDMVFTTLRRVIRKGNPFAADRSHIHHLMKDLGFSDRRALILIVTISVSLSFVGLMMHQAGVAESYQLATFVGSFLMYSFLISQAWQVAKRLQAANTAINVSFTAETGSAALPSDTPHDPQDAKPSGQQKKEATAAQEAVKDGKVTEFRR